MGLFDGSGDGNAFMGLLSNPQTAGLLGMAGGLLQASGPSRIPVSMGQAMGAGLQGMGQSAAEALNTQRQMLQMQAVQRLNGLLGANSTAPGSVAPAMEQQPAVAGAANVGPMSGLSSGMGGYAPMPSSAASSAAAAYPTQTGGPVLFGGKTPAEIRQIGMAASMAGFPVGAELMKMGVQYDPTLAMQMPTDITKMGYQGGLTPDQIQAANAAGVAKANYIAPVNARPGAILRNPLTMQPMAYNPQIPTGGTPLFDASGNVVGINSIPGAAGVTADMAAAKAGGEGSVLPYSGVDAAGNPLPVTNRTAAATGGMPAPLRNNNPGALMPGGQLAQYPDMQTGLAALDRNLQSYGSQGVNTLSGVISKWAPPNENNTQAYIQDVSQRLGVKPDQPIDLSNPAVRQAISTGIMLHENGPGAVFGIGAPAQPQAGTAIYAAPPLGATTFAQGQVKQMQDRFGSLRDQNSSAQTVISQLQNISSLAPQAVTGEEEGRRAYVNGLLALAGAPQAQDTKTATDLLNKYSNQIIAKLGQNGLGTDAARDIVAAGNPNAHMSVPAIQEAVQNLTGQYQLVQAKTSVLQQYANNNDPAGYTKAETAFDKAADPRIWQFQNMTPEQRQAFKSKMTPAQQKDFRSRIVTLQGMGAIQ